MMTLIIIRGLPGAGKTTIANKLVNILKAKNIWVDGFKHEAKTGSWLKDCNYAYRRTIKILEEYNKSNIKYVIITEPLYSKYFRDHLVEFIKKFSINAYWFQVRRPLWELLKIEDKRKNRKIKNTEKDFIQMQKKIDLCKIDREIIIQNIKVSLAVKKILRIVDH